MDYEVRVLADSLSPDGVRLTTLLTRYPRFIHSEMLRHRMFSHSVASSRAIPTEKQIERVRTDPFVPETFNQRVKGMGVGDALSQDEAAHAEHVWRRAATEAADAAYELNEIGLDKSRANRLLEPFIFVDDIISATEWDNFFALRDHPAAQPEFQKLARMMREALVDNEPLVINYGEWHLPLTPDFPMDDFDGDWKLWKSVSAGRCARISFDLHEREEEIASSIDRARRLIESGHLSPFEHVATPMKIEAFGRSLLPGRWAEKFCGNFYGWVQMRKQFSYENNFGALIAEVSNT